jgi:hypothetical protein
MQMEASLVSVGATAAESNGMECCLGFFCHEVKVAALHSCVHGGQGEVIVGWLTGKVSETIGGEVGVKDKQFAMIKTAQARIGMDSLAHLFKSSLGVIKPVWVDKIRVYFLKDNPEWRDAHLQVGGETSIELDEADKLCNVADQFWGQPRVEELVFGHGRLIAIDAYIDTNEFEPFNKDVRFLQTEGEILGLAYAELTLQIHKSHDKILDPAHDVIHDDGRV